MPLPDLLQWILQTRKTGCLRVEHKNVNRSIYCREGHVIACRAEDPSVLLGQFLLAHGRISEDVLRQGLASQEQTGKNLGRVLVEMGALRQEQLLKIVSSKAMETIHGLFDWEQGSFIFEPGVEPADDTIEVDLDVTEILLEGARRQDEMTELRQIFTSTEIVLERTKLRPDSTMIASPLAGGIYNSIDGKKTLAEILLECRVSEYMACQLLLRLHECEVVKIKGVREGEAEDEDEEHLDLAHAEELIAAGDAFNAFRVLRRLQDANPDDAAVKKLLTRAEAEFATSTYQEGLQPDCVPSLHVDLSEVPEGRLTPSELHILGKVDGKETVKSLMWTLPLRPVDVLWALKSLSDRDLIRIPPVAAATG